MLDVQLHRGFRYIHEPLPAGDGALPTLGHEELIGALDERLRYSHGGAFLVTGFRGVGKSTLVGRALTAAAGRWRGDEELLAVHLTVARAMTADELLFAIVRRIVETLDDRELLPRLPPDVQDKLLLAYMRTSLSYTQTHSESTERGVTLGAGMRRGALAALSPSLGLSRQRVQAQATEAAFLAYSETDVEYDLLRIIRLLSGGEGRAARPRRRPLRRRGRSGRLRVHPVVVLDEIDRLTDNREEALADLETLLARLKNVLTARGAHFVLVAGIDLHERAIRDAERGNGVYDSVFAWRMYVPCLWEAPERLVRALTSPDPGGPTGSGAPAAARPDTVEGGLNPWRRAEFVRYLSYKARGLTRRLLQEFNAQVVWENGAPCLRVPAEDWERVKFYSELELLVAAAVSDGRPAGLTSVPLDEDRWRLGGYHVVDWALRSRGRSFTAADIFGGGGNEPGIDPLLRMDGHTAERLLRHLTRFSVLEVVSEAGRPDMTVLGNPAEAQPSYYMLTTQLRRQLDDFARRSESERAELRMGLSWSPGLYETGVGEGHRTDDAEPVPAPAAGAGSPAAPVPSAPHVPTLPDGPLVPAAGAAANGGTTGSYRIRPAGAAAPPGPRPDPVTPITVLADRYEVRELIGQGGMGAVYRGRDTRTGQAVAVKLLNRSLAEDEEVRVRLQREARVGQMFRSPHVVRVLDFLDGPDPALVMELLQAPSLEDVLRDRGALGAHEVTRLGRDIGRVLEQAVELEVSRLDLKPSNVLLHPERGAVVIDLGIVRYEGRQADSLTLTGAVVGTPGYISPEQALGHHSDIRADLFVLGLILYTCLAGESPFDSVEPLALLYSVLTEDVPVDRLAVSDELRAVLRKLTAKEVDARYQTPAGFLADLAATPEAPGERPGRGPVPAAGP